MTTLAIPLFHTLPGYLFRQVLRPALVALGVMLALVWLLQSMRFLDFVINKGLGLGTFLQLTAMMIPALLLIVLPLGAFAGTVAASRRWQADSELTVMLATGQSRFRIALPALTVALLAVATAYGVSFWLGPISREGFNTMRYDLRTMNGNLLLEPGSFNQMGDLMIYLERRVGQMEFEGLLVHDMRDPTHPITWLAKSGHVERGPNGAPRIILNNGVQQDIRTATMADGTADPSGGRVEMLGFERQALDLEQQVMPEETKERALEREEMLLPQLLEAIRTAPDARRLNQNLTELNRRILWPLTPIPLTLVAAGLMLRRPQRYQSVFKQLAPPVLVAVVYYALLMAGTGWGERYGTPALLGLWALPLMTTIAGWWLLQDREK